MRFLDKEREDMVMLSLFSEEVSSNLSMPEILSEIFNTALVGYLIVFAVLGIIWGLLEIFGKIFSAKKKTAPAPVAVSSDEPDTQSGGDDGATVAAIIAAISAYTGKSSSSFRVVSFRKTRKK